MQEPDQRGRVVQQAPPAQQYAPPPQQYRPPQPQQPPLQQYGAPPPQQQYAPPPQQRGGQPARRGNRQFGPPKDVRQMLGWVNRVQQSGERPNINTEISNLAQAWGWSWQITTWTSDQITAAYNELTKGQQGPAPTGWGQQAPNGYANGVPY